jgi:hypothetical protein
MYSRRTLEHAMLPSAYSVEPTAKSFIVLYNVSYALSTSGQKRRRKLHSASVIFYTIMVCIAKVENSTYTMQCMHHALRTLIGLCDEPSSGALSATRVERESVSTAPNFVIESSSRVTSIVCMYDCLIRQGNYTVKWRNPPIIMNGRRRCRFSESPDVIYSTQSLEDYR